MPTLSPTHLAAIARRRRLIVNFDVTFAINVQHRRNPDRPDLVEHLFEFADAPRSQIDSMWWNWGEGNQAPYPSEHLPLTTIRSIKSGRTKGRISSAKSSRPLIAAAWSVSFRIA